ncbi:MAG: hypothetical protein HYT93_04195 [Parcubacteria group bacterium]|nr:hypothetical protein [Parcubacteria group bacterium]
MISNLRFKIRKLTYIIAGSALFLPLLVFAQSQPRTLTDLISRFVEILNALIPLLFGVALIGFLWGVGQFILQADNEEKRKEGRQIMIWGIIGLFVMTAVWGIILVIGGTFGVRFLERPQTPQLPGTSGNQNTSFGTENFIFSDIDRLQGVLGPLQ